MGVIVPNFASSTEDRASGAQVIDGSLKFNHSSETHLTRTPVAGNRRTFTWSCWVKLNGEDRNQSIFFAGPDGDDTYPLFWHTDTDNFTVAHYQGGYTYRLVPSALQRDTGWYHIVTAFDTTQSTSSNRIKFYINGERITDFSTETYPTLNYDNSINESGVIHKIGFQHTNNAFELNGSLSQCYFIDGQQLDASYFGFTDPLTGTWRPKKASSSILDSETILVGTPTYPSDFTSTGDKTSDQTGLSFGSWTSGSYTGAATKIFKNSTDTTFTLNVSLVGGTTDRYLWYSDDLTNWTYVTNMNPNRYYQLSGYKYYATSEGSNSTTLHATGDGHNNFYLPMDGNSPIGQDKSGRGNDWTPVNFGGSVELNNSQVSGARPILNTTQGGTQAGVGVFGSKENKYYTVTTANGSVYQFDITSGDNPSLEFIRGATYKFDYSSFTGHPVLFSSTNPDSSTTAYTTGTSISSNVISFTVPHDAPDTLYYYCQNHPTSMNGAISVTTDETKADKYAANCVLALPLVGSNIDVSDQINCTTSAKTLAVNGDAASSGEASNFYAESFKFDGSGDYLGATSNSDFAMGTGDFTLECWAYRTGGTAFVNFIATRGAPGTTAGYTFGAQGSANGYDVEFYTNGLQLDGGTQDITYNKWHHVAVTRTGTTLSSYVNGVLNTTTTNSQNFTNTSLSVGMTNDGSQGPMQGHLCDVRVYKGVAKYSGGSVGDQVFVVPSIHPDILPDTPSGVSGSSKLAKYPSADGGSTTFGVETSKLTNVGDFAGISGTGDYTVSFWFYANEFSSSDNNGGDGGFLYILNQGNSHPTYPIKIDISKAGKVIVADSANFGASWYSTFNNAGSYDTDHNVVLGKWNYIHVYRESGTLNIYNNGGLQLSISQSNSSPAGISTEFCTNTSNVILKDLRITNTAITDATPPTSPLTAVSGTQLLICHGNGLTDVSGNSNTLSTTGTVTDSKFNPFTTDINTVRGQETGYCTLNPLHFSAQNSGTGAAVLSNGNLDATVNTSAYKNNFGTIPFPSSGKYYFEVTVTSNNGTGNNQSAGIASIDDTTNKFIIDCFATSTTSKRKIVGTTATNLSGSFNLGDVIGVAVDCDSNTTLIKHNNANIDSGYSMTSGVTFAPFFSGYNCGNSSFNFGQKPFKFPPPEGFQPLNSSTVRPSTVIARPDQYVGVATYTGNGGTQSINVGLKPDLIWIKNRDSGSYGHRIVDSVRGSSKFLMSHNDGTESTAADGVTSFNIDGFSLSSNNDYNLDNNAHVSWCWKAGGNKNTFNVDNVGYSTYTDAPGLSDGTIKINAASVGTKQGFSIIKYTGNNTNNATIPHGLSQTPDFVIVKNLDDSRSWNVYHQAYNASTDKALVLDGTGATAGDKWVTSLFSSTVFGVLAVNQLNQNNSDHIAYIWHDVPGLQKFGTYEGNNSTDGPFIELGFRPAIIIFRNIDSSSPNWEIYDFTERDKINPYGKVLCPNSAIAENDVSASYPADALSNGIKIRHNGAAVNAANTYIYAAWAEAPSFNLYGAQSNAR